MCVCVFVIVFVHVCSEEMVFRTGGCQRQNGDDDKCISTGSVERVALLFNKISAGTKGDTHTNTL